ncbi:myosin-4-like [Stegodyphus dumicola]|uniref:myosin-4-like n=1 Tax=Stegodyphus dumicola TaxID=202533 RepID=UPI0015AF524F|nr:myosin-4-like [Stegodyphus dumicola]
MSSGQTDGVILPECLCSLQLPHSEEHASALPRQQMPTLYFPESSESVNCSPKSRRLQELLTDLKSARSKDLELGERFDRNTEQIMREFYDAEENRHGPLDLECSPLDEKGIRLKYELEHSRFQLAEVRNQLHTLKRELIAYKKLIRQEVGDHLDLHDILTDKRWKGRAQEIERLRSQIAGMESKAFGHKYLRNPLCPPQYTSRFPTTDDLIPRSQAEYLKREARKRREKQEEVEKEVSGLLKEYGNVSLAYKASLIHNKMLAEELRSLKEQLEGFEKKAKEDRQLIKDLTAYQLQMREMLEREAHLAELVRKNEKHEEYSEREEEWDASKYKALWEASEFSKQTLQDMVRLLTTRVEEMAQEAETAEQHCLENQARQKELEQQLEAQKEAEKAAVKTKDPKSKGAAKGAPQPVGPQLVGKSMPIGAQLQLVRAENAFLKNFVRRALQSKEQDIQLYKHTMSCVRELYVAALHRIQSATQTLGAGTSSA